MEKKQRDSLYRAAIKAWGHQSQVDKLIEEMSELTKALLKARRNEVVFTNDIVEEFADVMIMLEQLKLYYDDNCGPSFEKEIKVSTIKKLQRIKGLLKPET